MSRFDRSKPAIGIRTEQKPHASLPDAEYVDGDVAVAASMDMVVFEPKESRERCVCV